jgi:hypothetical protein
MRARNAVLLFATALVAGMVFCGSAKADTYNFSFSNSSLGDVNGTVTGQIVGLCYNGTCSATAVYVDSYPAGLNEFGSYPAPFNVLNWTGGTIGENSFTVVDGVITGGGFDIYGANGVNDQLYIDSNCCGGAGTNFLDIGSDDSLYVWNDNGIGDDGVTFSVAGSTTPEPGSLFLLGTGLLAAFIITSRCKQ